MIYLLKLRNIVVSIIRIIIVAAGAFTCGLFYGVIVGKFEIPPYATLNAIYDRFYPDPKPNGPWSIGIYTGSSPLKIADSDVVSNPVLTYADVTDIDAVFVADPFVIKRSGTFYMFFEVLNRENDQGDIALATSPDGYSWSYERLVLDEDFHLSYPSVFIWEDEYYMVPESNEDFSVRLYKAENFPHDWSYVGNLLSGYKYIDPTLFQYNDRWWMFVSRPDNSVLDIYFSDSLLSGWRPHPMNPIRARDQRYSRPAGPVINMDGKLYRLTQDDEGTYGKQIFAFEIVELTETSYLDTLVSTNPIIGATGHGWNAVGMHHLAPFLSSSDWLAAVDGRDK